MHPDATKFLADSAYEDQFEQTFADESLEGFFPVGIEFERWTFPIVISLRLSLMNANWSGQTSAE